MIPKTQFPSTFETGGIHPIRIQYHPILAGGGNEFGIDFVRFVKRHIGKVETVFEWCSGPAFIGYSLLAEGLCESLVLGDINPLAIESCRETARLNGVQKQVMIFQSDGFKSIPEREKFDLVVGNPPFSGNTSIIPGWGEPLKYQDEGWRLHIDFYNSVGSRLKENGQVVIAEHFGCSRPEIFEPMIQRGNLIVNAVLPCGISTYNRIYYVWSKLPSTV